LRQTSFGLQRRGPVKLGYDVFRKLDDGSAVWVREAATLDEAKAIIKALSRGEPSGCFIRDATTGKILAETDLENFGEACA